MILKIKGPFLASRTRVRNLTACSSQNHVPASHHNKSHSTNNILLPYKKKHGIPWYYHGCYGITMVLP